MTERDLADLLRTLAEKASSSHESEWMGLDGMICKKTCRLCAAITAAYAYLDSYEEEVDSNN